MSYEAIPMKGWCDNGATKTMRGKEARRVKVVADYAIRFDNLVKTQDVSGLCLLADEMEESGLVVREVRQAIAEMLR